MHLVGAAQSSVQLPRGPNPVNVPGPFVSILASKLGVSSPGQVLVHKADRDPCLKRCCWVTISNLAMWVCTYSLCRRAVRAKCRRFWQPH